MDAKQVPAEPMMRLDPPKLDLKVRILFEENLYTMIFPKVKELLFRVSRASPLELAAKALARKNEHAGKWRDYSFTLIASSAKDTGETETQVEDLSQTFDMLLANQSNNNAAGKELLSDELVLFYKVKDLEPFNFKAAVS